MTELSSYGGAKDVLKKATRKNPVLVIYYAEWCGHCQKRQQMWKDFDNKFKNRVSTYKLESANLGDGSQEIQGFPTYQISTGKSKKTKSAQEETDPQKMYKELFGSKKRLTTRRMRSARRKATHRTFGHHMRLT